VKLNSISARVIAAGVMSVGVLAGAGAVTEPASASTPTHLCIHFASVCIYASGPHGAELAPSTTPGMTNWNYPALGATSAISQANVNTCLQLDWSAEDPDTRTHLVIGAPCVNDTAEQWTNVYDSVDNRTWFVSKWASDDGQGQLCLFSDPDDNDLSVLSCQSGPGSVPAYMDWGTS
jgi:hypothetical protein